MLPTTGPVRISEYRSGLRGASRQSAAAGDLTPTFDMPGGVFGLALGYNWQFGRSMLYGFDSDVSLNTQRGTSGYLGAPAGFTAEISEQWLATYRGRVGYVRDSWMIYLTAGGATAECQDHRHRARRRHRHGKQDKMGMDGGGGRGSRTHSFLHGQGRVPLRGFRQHLLFQPAASRLHQSRGRRAALRSHLPSRAQSQVPLDVMRRGSSPTPLQIAQVRVRSVTFSLQ